MTENEILDVFTRILRDLLSNESINLTMETLRSDVPDWDSLNYISFIVAAESKLRIKFRVADIESFENVGAIVRKAKKLLDR
jgi:acyl carrier protein